MAVPWPRAREGVVRPAAVLAFVPGVAPKVSTLTLPTVPTLATGLGTPPRDPWAPVAVAGPTNPSAPPFAFPAAWPLEVVPQVGRVPLAATMAAIEPAEAMASGVRGPLPTPVALAVGAKAA